jgi:preprotein translocase subunit SecY
MIRPLRATHRAVFLFLPIFLALVLMTGLVSRYRWPTPVHTSGQGDVVLLQQVVTTGDGKLKIQLLSNSAMPVEVEFKLLASSTLIAPDLLVYWAEDSGPKTLHPNARFLGPYRRGATYRLPADARSKGSVSLYSLAQQKVVTTIPLGANP